MHTYVREESNENKTSTYTCKGCSVKLVTGRYSKSHVRIKSLNRHTELCKFNQPTLEIGGIYKYQTFKKLDAVCMCCWMQASRVSDQ